MLLLFLFSLFTNIAAAPLQQNSLITLRTVLAPKATGGGNVAPPPPYGPLVLEEWDTTGLVQSWSPPCTLPGLSAEAWTEGSLNPRFPWGDQVWFLCRNVPVNSSLATNPAPVNYMVLNEDGVLSSWVEEPLYPNGTNVISVLPYIDLVQGINVFYLLGGGTVASGSPTTAKTAQPRIRVDSGPGVPPDAQGALLASMTGTTINELRILNNTLYGTGLFASSTGLPNPTIFQIGAEGTLPTGTRNPVTQIPNFPLVLSSWTEPHTNFWWRTGFNRTAYLALHNNADGSDLVFPVPPAASAGTLGGPTWSVATARREASDFAVYLTNTSHIVKNTLNGLQSGLAYQPIVQAPPGWRFLSAHARNPSIPSPTATATATASASASASATATSSSVPTSTASATATSSPTASASATSRPSSTSSASASASSSAYPTSISTASRNPNASPASPTSSVSITPSTTPSNGTLPVPPENNQVTPDALTPGAQAGITLGSVAAVCIAGLLLLKFSSPLQNLWTRQFGSSLKTAKKGVSFRKPVSTDVPITISHNPQVLVQHRIEQLKDLQKQLSMREANAPQQYPDLDRTKKEFGPVIMGNSV